MPRISTRNRVTLSTTGKTYFASDIHLGIPDYESSLKREKRFVAWLDHIREDADRIFLLGDIFDFWFEYKRVVPRGFTRLLGKIAELTDAGLPVHFFTGNHDLWIFDYLPEEIGITVHKEPLTLEIEGKRFFLSHGDGLGPGDGGYKFLKKVFTNKTLQWMFARLHPNFAIWLASKFSADSRQSNLSSGFLGEDEWLVRYAYEILGKEHYDFFIFGHRHIPIDISLKNGSRFIYLGDWITHFTYGVFDGTQFSLKIFKPSD
jgi:UDP-2,3-diacylglucosamine hydrolase